MTEKVGPPELELLDETIVAVAEQKISHLVTSVPPDIMNSPLVADVIASETQCDGQLHNLRHSSYQTY